MSDDEVITRSALGRIGGIGDLYDARKDGFCQINIFSSPPPPSAMKESDHHHSNYNFIVEDTYSEKLTKLHVKAELKVSFLAGLVTLSGAGVFLNDEKKSSRSAKATLTYSILRKNERLNMSSKDLSEVLALDTIGEGAFKNATHVVTEIDYGANVHVVLEYENKENEDTTEIMGSLHAIIQKSISVEASARVEIENLEKIKGKRFALRIHGDVVSEDEVPQTFEEALKLIQKVPKLVDKINGGKGIPMIYKMEPISRLQKLFKNMNQISATIHFLKDSSIIQFVNVFDDILSVKQQLNDLIHDLRKYQNHLPPSSLGGARDLEINLEMEEADLKADLSKILIDVRSGRQRQSKLFNLVKDYKEKEYSAGKVQKLIDDKFDEDMKKIDFVKTLQKQGVTCLERKKTLDSLILQPKSSTLVLFRKSPGGGSSSGEDDEQRQKEMAEWTQNRTHFYNYVVQHGGPSNPAARHSQPDDSEEAADGRRNILFKNNLKFPTQEPFQLSKAGDLFSVTIMGKLGPTAKWFELVLDEMQDESFFSLKHFVTERKTVVSSKIGPRQKNEWTHLTIEPDALFYIQIERDENGFKVTFDNDKNRTAHFDTKFRETGSSLRVKVQTEGEVMVNILSVTQPKSQDERPATSGGEAMHFVFVDCDIHPLIKEKSNCIHKYENGNLVTRDWLKEELARLEMTTKPMGRHSSTVQLCQFKPNKRTEAKFRCPGSLKGGRCVKSAMVWHCDNCWAVLEYGFDDHLYCQCGKGQAFAMIFRCTDPQHGTNFIKFSNPRDLTDQLNLLKPIKFQQLNILILGTTGVGKSTFINGLANYMTHDKLDDAVRHGVITVIPSSFSMQHQEVKGGPKKMITIRSGEDDGNENDVPGQSCTQFPKTHRFPRGNTIVNIIDTPGIGDTKGVEQDKENLERIMHHIAQFKELHGICVLLKPNEERLGIPFQLCFQELMAYLSWDAVKNLVFCFTNAKSTCYTIGATYNQLETLLTKIKKNGGPTITLSDHTTYVVDNEAFRFLAALEAGVKLDITSFTDSWDRAVQETERLVQHFLQLPPHRCNNTVSLNFAHQTILRLARPIPTVCDVIQENIELLNRNMARLTRTQQQGEDLRNEAEALKKVLEECKKKIEEYKEEQCQIMKTSAVFAAFLKHHAIAPYNDALLAYMDCLIDNAKKFGSTERHQALLQLKEVYEAEIHELEKQLKTKNSVVIDNMSPDSVKKKLEQLYHLPLTGKIIKKIIEMAETSRNKFWSCGQQQL